MKEEYRVIKIDFDVHKLIEAHRDNFSETPNTVLRRLLNLPVLPLLQSLVVTTDQDSTESKRSWSDDGLTLPHGTKLRMYYNKQWFVGVVSDGQLVVNGKAFQAPSAAAMEVGITKQGKKTHLNGWRCWEAQLPEEIEWNLLDVLRSRACKSLLDDMLS